MYVYNLIQELVRFDNRDVQVVAPLNGKPQAFKIIRAMEIRGRDYIGLDVGASLITNWYNGGSRMQQVARLFGKELNQEFKVECFDTFWARFTEKTFQTRATVACEWRESDTILRRLINGEARII